MAKTETIFNLYSHSMSIGQNGLPLVYVTINGKNYNFLVSTSCLHNTLRPEVWEEVIESSLSNPKLITICEGDRQLQTEIGHIPFEVKGVKYESKFLIIDDNLIIPDLQEFTFFPYHGILGSRFLFEHKWIIDYKKKRIYEFKEKTKKNK